MTDQLTLEQCMLRIAKIVSEAAKIPDHCSLDREDIFQEVCIIYLEECQNKSPDAINKMAIKRVAEYVEQNSLQIACGLLLDAVADKEESAAWDEAAKSIMRDTIDEVLDTILPRERTATELRFGIDQDCKMSFNEVGKQFGVTTERARQIINKALRKLRHPCRSGRLRGMLEIANYGLLEPSEF